MRAEPGRGGGRRCAAGAAVAGLEDGRTVLVELLMVLLLLLLIAAGAAAGELLPQLPDAVNVGAARCLGCGGCTLAVHDSALLFVLPFIIVVRSLIALGREAPRAVGMAKVT